MHFDDPDTQAAFEKLMKTPVVFGLRNQGHLPTVERMLAEGASWAEIGAEIGWDGETARRYYEEYERDAS